MNRKGVIRRLFDEMVGRYKAALVLVFAFILISTGANVAGSFFIERLIDQYIPGIMASSPPVFDGLLRALALMGGVYLLGVVSTLLYDRMMVSISQGVQKNIRERMFAHMQNLPINYFDTHTHGNTMSRYTNDTDTLRAFFAQSLPQLVSAVFTIIMVTIAMLALSPILTIVVFVFVGLNLIVTQWLSKIAAKLFMRQQSQIGKLNGFIKEMINGGKTIKVFCHEDAAINDFDAINDELRGYGKKANSLTNMLMPFAMNIGAIQYVAIAVVGGILALNNIGTITLGTIAAFLTLSKTFSAPIGQISAQVNAMTMAFAGAERIFELIDEQPEADNGYVTLVNAKYEEDGSVTEAEGYTGLWAWKHPHEDGTLTYTKLRGDVRLFDVDFGYVENKMVLKNISLYAKPGQKIAFVGSTGAGKTTITNLLNRFYEIADGKIRYDGININKIKKADLRRSLGIVLQDTHLFTGTIADNICYGKLNATDEEIRCAAKIANADSFISRLPDNYDTFIEGDGGNLSGGQRQLIAIARVAVANPPVMILDEATSSIDTRTEAIVQRGMDGLMDGRTVFVIAHRLSTVKNSKAIMVLENGNIIERGDHDELIKKRGKYYQLYTGTFAK